MNSTNSNITLADLDKAPEVVPEQTPLSKEDTEKLQENFSRLADDNIRLAEELDSIKRDGDADLILNKLIAPTAKRTFVFMCVYCGFVGLIILMNGFSCFKRPINDGVIQILVGSTAATVIGLVGMVVTGIFVGARARRK